MIIFEKIRIKNFLSYGNSFTELNFLSHGTTLISGHNGSGKSVLLTDALTFCLFDKSYRKVPKKSIVNWKNKSDCLVEVYFKKNGIDYKIVRGIKPNVFEIYESGILINQSAESRDYQEFLESKILNMSFNIFCSTVIVGQNSFQSFYKFSTPDRRKFIENLLNLNIFAVMLDINKKKLSAAKIAQESNRIKLKEIKSRLDHGSDYIKKMQENLSSKIKIQQDYISEIDSSIHEKQLVKDDLEFQIQQIKIPDFNIDIVNKRIKQFSDLIVASDVKKSYTKTELDNFSNLDICPTCTQHVSDDLKKTKQVELNQTLEKLETACSDLKEKLEAESKKLNDYQNALYEKEKLEQSKQKVLSEIDRLVSDKIFHTSGSYSFDINQTQSNLDELKENLKNNLKEYETLLDEKSTLNLETDKIEFISTLLSDTGIKAAIIKNYLPIFIQTVNKNLNSFGYNLRVDFDETFTETFFVSGFQPQSYDNFSAGERLRIDMSTLLALREMIKLQSTFECNLLILDELLDSSLDETGLESFIEMLKDIGDLNLFIVSHNQTKYNAIFQRELLFKKDLGYSVYEEKIS